MKRHDMLFLDSEGREFALRAARDIDPGLPAGLVDALLDTAIPFIVRRQEQTRDGIWEVGFSLPIFRNGVRVRAASLVPEAHIIRVVTPCEAVGLPALTETARQKKEILELLVFEGGKLGITVGLYGAFALELLTGLSYTTPTSDLDIAICPANPAPDLPGLLEKAEEIEAEYGVPLDIEASCGDGYGVKLKELLSEQRTVLGKGLYDIRLLPRNEARGSFRV